MSTTLTPTTRRRSVLAVVAALATAVSLAVATPASAATGAQTGEWDVVATSNAVSPKIQSYNHTSEVFDTVTPSGAWFAVGSGKVISEDEDGTTPVKGGGIHFENTATTAKQATFRFTVPANVGLVVKNGTRTVVSSAATSSARQVTWTTPSVPAGGEFHEHFTWTFSGSASAANVGVAVSVPGSGGYSASTTYRFTF
ncbi:hypothetical protein [Cellulomonas sp. SLBN-39]|uniref:hypothetical protein n=1 Tax=Cellulomonas sp. SLBN-39 TaxID=2768446 RepID=UPI001151C2E0|nr:hypothetical protein [Cellulomonas sp. SLBN-39]TQL01398.1 hypothetical protein FBY24_0447 [Cellulomonas sp. SLBN-39]